jgi:hypothetical protein
VTGHVGLATTNLCSWQLIPYPARSIALAGRTVGSVWPESEPLAFRQMAGSHHHEVPSVERGHLAKVEAFGQGDDACVDGLEPERGVGSQQFGHATVVVRCHLDDAQLVRRDGGTEPGGKVMTPAALRVGQQVADLGDRKGRHDETGPVLREETDTSLVIFMALLNAATSGPVSQRITRTPLRRPARDPDTRGICRGYGQDRPDPGWPR